MTARDPLPYPVHNEAAAAIYRLLPPCHARRGQECAACRRQAEEYVEALLPFVAGLAIERGALAEADVYDAEDIARGAPGQLYRVVEP